MYNTFIELPRVPGTATPRSKGYDRSTEEAARKVHDSVAKQLLALGFIGYSVVTTFADEVVWRNDIRLLIKSDAVIP